MRGEAAATPRAGSGRRALRRLWVIASTAEAAPHLPGLLPPAALATVPASLPDALRSAAPGDAVLLAGLTLADTVDSASALLARGVAVAVDLRHEPAIRRALGERRWGIDAVLLSPRTPSRSERAVMRLRDVTAAGAGLVLLAPLFALLAALITRSSPGPVFFTTTVVGRDGRTFTWRKFRSMTVGSVEDEARRRERYRAFVQERRAGEGEARGARKIVDEARVTGIGRFMRRHSLDELPQLWNVLRGEMTLVGPRPCLPYEYELQAPWQRLRYRVTPGLTGPWQAYGGGRMTVDEMALLDYCYGYRRSFLLDLRLILRTMRVVITGEGGK